ncbi:MAG: hypothetical protein MUD14_11285 [Hydrococcus sp. Prado102]|jgi:tetratricopeptide (TPR) repeat protein|nr:hypothetical protein [Hydrococcus sp. Prado102]
MLEQSSPVISTNLLTPHDRPIKLPLQKWLKIVTDRFVSVISTTETSQSKYGEVAACFNLAALIETYAGRVDNAAQLCHAQLHWLFRIAETTSSLEALVSSFQPWINLGRIDYNQRRYEQALHKFQLLFNINKSTGIYFKPITISSEKWQEIKRVYPETQSIIDNVFIVDSLKAMIKAKKHTKILRFFDKNFSEVNFFLKDYLIEAKILSLWTIGEKYEAVKMAAKQVDCCLDKNKITFMLRQAEALRAFGNTKAASIITQQLYLIIKKFDLKTSPNIHLLSYSLRIAELLYLLEKTELAYEILEAGYYGTTIIDDEPLRVSFLEILINIETDKIKLDLWKQNLHDLLSNTCYWFLKKKKTENDCSEHLTCSTSLYRQLITFAEHQDIHQSANDVRSQLVV